MGKLSVFLRPSPADRTREVFLERFVDDQGEMVPFVVKSITSEENEAIAKKCMDKRGNVDTAAYGNHLIVACMAEPDLRSTEVCSYYGVMDPHMVPGRMFTVGEKQIIQDAIMDINDIKSAREKLDEAKNS